MSDPCIAAGQISQMQADIAVIKNSLENLNSTITSAFSRIQANFDDHETRLRCLEDVTRALGQIEEHRVEIDALKKEVRDLKSSEDVRAWWESKKGITVLTIVTGVISLITGILIVRFG